MFESLSDKLKRTLKNLRGEGVLTKEHVDAALREIRLALLEADVNYKVAKEFMASVKEKAEGQQVWLELKPSEQVVKIVFDELVELLGGQSSRLVFTKTSPNVVMIVGLQGSGKTTSTGKIARWLTQNQQRKPLLLSTDVYRPAAREQLKVIAHATGQSIFEKPETNDPLELTREALKQARDVGYDTLLIDTAGRLHIDDELMEELVSIKSETHPVEILFVADAMTGQDAVNVAKSFNERVGVTGIVLTRVDGDARGGAALSMRQVTGRPIKLIGVGEKLDALEDFHPDRIAGRILGMGDVLSLVEKAAETIEEEEAEKLAAKVAKGRFDLDDMAKQLKQILKMGGLGGIVGMLPGIGKLQKQIEGAKIDDKMVRRQLAIISSMTVAERRNPDIVKASRRRRIAGGSGTSVQDVNKLLKQHQEMSRMVKQVSKLGQKGLLRHGLSALRPGGFKT